ncbi:MAG: phosphate transport system permease protein [Pseudonocardiales bacterium]|jgi:phosphate transport system permease protein|nr:phosphate transport system permease protein [Pseudonocardiales bacterium]
MTTAGLTQPSSLLAKSRSRTVKNHLATVLVLLSFAIALIPLVWVLWTVASNGLSTITRASWWTGTMRNVTYTDPGGGARHAIIGTLEQVALCTAISVPLALMVGIYLVEYGGNLFARVTTFMVDVLTGIPSIVAGLFIFALLHETLGVGLSGWLVSMALVVLMVPVIVRSTEEMLRLVPNELREASYALGIPKWRTIVKVVIPTAFTGIITGIVLGIARVAGETAPLLILVSTTDDTNWNLLDGNQTALPTLIAQAFRDAGQTAAGGGYTFDANGNKVYGGVTNFAIDRMWGAALTLILIILLLTLIARLIGRFNKLAK